MSTEQAGGSITDWIDHKYQDEVWAPIVLRPDAVSTTRYDDIARLARGERGRAVDIGCGSGQLLIALADQFDQMVGVDISDLRIRRAEAALAERYPHLRDKLHFERVAPAAALPFADGSFDVVIASVVLEVVPDVFFAMDEIARVCRPGGAVLISVGNICYLKNVVDLLAGRIPVTWSTTRDMAHWRTHGWDDGCLRYFSQGALRDLLRHVGFTPEAWSGCGALAKYRRWYLNLCGGLTVRARRVDGRSR